MTIGVSWLLTDRPWNRALFTPLVTHWPYYTVLWAVSRFCVNSQLTPAPYEIVSDPGRMAVYLPEVFNGVEEIGAGLDGAGCGTAETIVVSLLNPLGVSLGVHQRHPRAGNGL